MKIINKEVTKLVTTYIANDGSRFTTEKDCKEHENLVLLNNLHKMLIKCNFHDRFKIIPYFHNRDITTIGNGFVQEKLNEYVGETPSYLLMGGRMGNGDCRVRYKIRGKKHILLLRYSHDSDIPDQVYLGKIPYSWTTLSKDELQIEVDNYIANRKVFVKVVTNNPIISYKEI
jgi:hypothetical protein